MMRTTSTKCEAGSSRALIAQIVTGTLFIAGVAALVWIVSHHTKSTPDPQAEIDRRINDLEDSLSRLQDVFGHALRS